MWLVPAAWRTSHIIVASGHPEYPPFSWRQEETIIGVGPSLFRSAFEALGLTVETPYSGTWVEVLEKTQ